MSTTALALLGFAGWQIILTIALGSYRTALVQMGRKAPNQFAPDGSDVPGFGQRLTRARDNCYENLPMFAAIVLAASLLDRTNITDPLAMPLLYARVAQSVTHLISTSPAAILVRFGFYIAQIAILGWWVISLILG